MEMTTELMAKAKEAKTPEELMALAKENGGEMTEESAKAYFELLHPQNGELADEELDNVAGGGCYKDDNLVVSAAHCCSEFLCKKCFRGERENIVVAKVCSVCGALASCNNCMWCKYEKGLWLCTHKHK